MSHLSDTLGNQVLIANTHALQAELSDEKRFKKKVGNALKQVYRPYKLSCLIISNSKWIGQKPGWKWPVYGVFTF